MGKTKSAKPDQAKSSKDSQVKPLSAVKKGAVTKPSQTPKAKSKEMAKQVATKSNEASKKSKKPVKQPSPDDSDESDSSEEEQSSVASSASSDDKSDDEPAPKINGSKTNGVAKAATKVQAESSESSDSSDEEDTKPSAPKGKAAPQVTAGKEESGSDEDSEDDSEADSSEEESDDDVKVKGPVDANALNGKLEEVTSADASSGSESDEEASIVGSDSDAEEDSSEDESEEEVPAPKKRKAEEVSTPAAKKTKPNEPADEAKKNLFVGQLSWNIDEEWLTREFETFGEIENVTIIYDKQSGRSKGFGYVKFVNAASGEKAKAEKHRTELDGRTINVDFNQPKDNSTPRQERAQKYGDSQPSEVSSTLFVANLAFDATSDLVGEEFGKHGSVIGVRLPTDKDTGAPKGFGYVEFSSVEEAQKVFGAMSGATIMGRPIRLDYSTPRPPRNDDSPGGFRGGRGGRGGFDRGGRGGGRGRGGFDRGGRGGDRGGRGRGGRGGTTNRGGFGDFQGKKMSLS
ncbi:MAG: hypothetical protein Q9164_004064 [Protoblastenia rupestris]